VIVGQFGFSGRAGRIQPSVRGGSRTGWFPVLPVPVLLEDYLQQFDRSLVSRARHRALRDYVIALLQPRDRNKTLTALAGAEPLVGACHRQVQRLQWFLSESPGTTRRCRPAGGVDLLLGLADAEPRISPRLGSLGPRREAGDHAGRRGAVGRVIDRDGHALRSAQRLSCRG
jgi:hypothetical protein